LQDLDAQLHNELAAIAERHRIDIQIVRILDKSPVLFDSARIATVQHSADALGYSNRQMPSGAFHDAAFISEVAPTAMIFVPCEGGVSHNERENAKAADLAAGADVLLHAILERASLIP
jgi:N-carbamoyl-L-amino-acid hydrolase